MRKIRLIWLYFGQYLLALACVVCSSLAPLTAKAVLRDDAELRMYAQEGIFIVGLLALWRAVRWQS